MDPVLVAWTAAGEPTITTLDAGEGSCARCLRRDRRARLRSVVSNKFTGAAGWPAPDEDALCRACTWAYRDKDLRTRPHHLDAATEQLVPLDATALRRLLEQGALPPSQIATLPLSRRKHCLPTSAWAALSVDGVPIPWTSHDATRLPQLHRLRRWGIAAARLSDPAPPWPAVRDATPQRRQEILSLWEDLEPWRQRPLWLEVAISVTHPEASKGAP